MSYFDQRGAALKKRVEKNLKLYLWYPFGKKLK